jgi:hypothetical protein
MTKVGQLISPMPATLNGTPLKVVVLPVAKK